MLRASSLNVSHEASITYSTETAFSPLVLRLSLYNAPSFSTSLHSSHPVHRSLVGNTINAFFEQFHAPRIIYSKHKYQVRSRLLFVPGKIQRYSLSISISLNDQFGLVIRIPNTQTSVEFHHLDPAWPRKISLPQFRQLLAAVINAIQRQIEAHGEDGQMPSRPFRWTQGLGTSIVLRAMYVEPNQRAVWGQAKRALIGLRMFYIERKILWATVFYVCDEYEGRPLRVWLFGQVLDSNGPGLPMNVSSA